MCGFSLKVMSQSDANLDRHVASCKLDVNSVEWGICQHHLVTDFILAGLCFRDLSLTIVRDYTKKDGQSTKSRRCIIKGAL